MKSYFEDSIPFIQPGDVRVRMETPRTFNVVPDLVRIHFTQYLRDLIRPQEPLSPIFWGTSWKPGLLTRYRDTDSICWVLDDYGNLVTPEPDEDGGVMQSITPPPFCINVEGNDWSLCAFVIDDYGDVWVWEHEDEENNYFMCPLREDGTPLGIFDHDGFTFCALPNFMELSKIIPASIHEHGWEILHSHATLDGMLCIRWLGLYGDCPEEYKVKKWGFNGEPTNFWNGLLDVQKENYDPNSRSTRRFARQMFQHETSMVKEVAAEVFPMEIGSLLARWKYHEEKESIVGLMIDPAITQLRRIYAQDCYSQYNESTNQLEAERQYLEYWEGWSGARTAYESLPMKKRLRRTYTEGFLQDSTPCAMVVYGEEQNLSTYQQSWVKKFRKNGFPIYWLQPTTEI